MRPENRFRFRSGHLYASMEGPPTKGTVMEKDVAQSILALMFEYGAKLNDSMLMVRESGDSEEFSRYRRAVGNVLDATFEHIIDPILAEHPDLKPEQLNLEKPE